MFKIVELKIIQAAQVTIDKTSEMLFTIQSGENFKKSQHKRERQDVAF